MKKMLNVCAVLLLSIFAFGFTACTAASSSGSSAVPVGPYKVIHTTTHGNADLTLNTYDEKSFSGTYTLVIEVSGYTESGTFQIIKNPGSSSEDPWIFKTKPDSGTPQDVNITKEKKTAWYDSEQRQYKFDLSGIPLPQ